MNKYTHNEELNARVQKCISERNEGNPFSSQIKIMIDDAACRDHIRFQYLNALDEALGIMEMAGVSMDQALEELVTVFKV